MIVQNFTLLLLFLSLSAVTTVISDVLGKQWILTNKVIYFITAIILVIISAIFFILSLKYEKLGIVSVAWDAITSLFLIIIGYFLFKESLNIVQIIGIGLIFSGMFLLFYKF